MRRDVEDVNEEIRQVRFVDKVLRVAVSVAGICWYKNSAVHHDEAGH